jgi:CheY-like chemotaxis protein
MLAVSDTGMGMSDEVKAHLFEPFYTTKGVGKGTGLGLATCYGIASQSGGDIRVYREVGVGTTIKIYLPRVDAPAHVETKAQDGLPSGSESILVVEDDAAVRDLALVVLRDLGYRVQEATNAIDALAIIDRTQFDLVISDVIMPRMSGKALYDELRRRAPTVKMLLMSGYTDDALEQRGALEEGLAFLEKPFSPARLARKVRDVLDATSPMPRVVVGPR